MVEHAFHVCQAVASRRARFAPGSRRRRRSGDRDPARGRRRPCPRRAAAWLHERHTASAREHRSCRSSPSDDDARSRARRRPPWTPGRPPWTRGGATSPSPVSHRVQGNRQRTPRRRPPAPAGDRRDEGDLVHPLQRGRRALGAARGVVARPLGAADRRRPASTIPEPSVPEGHSHRVDAPTQRSRGCLRRRRRGGARRAYAGADRQHAATTSSVNELGSDPTSTTTRAPSRYDGRARRRLHRDPHRRRPGQHGVHRHPARTTGADGLATVVKALSRCDAAAARGVTRVTTSTRRRTRRCAPSTASSASRRSAST